MEKNLGDYRKSYEKAELVRENLPENPLTFFQRWFDEAEQSKSVEEPNAMTLSTIGKDGFPKSRVVLLKKLTDKGFVFYTNYDSVKGKSMVRNPKICLSFFWPGAERQVIIKGTAHKVSSETSDNYFHSRPKGSQLGAIVSPQSEPIPDRGFLEKRLQELETKYQDKTIERPENWGGYLTEPHSIEFWQGRPNRLHDRFIYEKDSEGNWEIIRLAP